MQDSNIIPLTANDILKHNSSLDFNFRDSKDSWVCLVIFVDTFADESRRRYLLDQIVEMIEEKVPGFKKTLEETEE